MGWPSRQRAPERTLAAYTIKKLKDKVPEIKEMIRAWWPSFGAKKVEETNFFYQRAS